MYLLYAVSGHFLNCNYLFQPYCRHDFLFFFLGNKIYYMRDKREYCQKNGGYCCIGSKRILWEQKFAKKRNVINKSFLAMDGNIITVIGFGRLKRDS